MHTLDLALRIVVLATASTLGVPAADLRSETIAAFDRYVVLTEHRMAAERDGRAPFLWLDRQSEADRASANRLLRDGQVVSARLETRDGARAVDAPHGLIHHWVGTVLLPGVTLDRATAFVQDYARYPDLFAPLIQRSRVLAQTPDRFDVAMRTSMKKVKTVVIDADYRVDYRRLSLVRLDSASVATNLYEVEAAGQPAERRVPAERSAGYLWRLNTYCRFEQRAEGTYEQCESISLTRDVPFGLGWLIKPFVTGIPRETLEFTLGRVRRALVRP